MISVKGGTQTWSKAEQTSALKAETKNTMSAQNNEIALGNNENIGEMLNKISDPNWIDPVKARRVGNDELGKDAFLKLLLAQMKNQDPTSPMESHQMAAQLAQFSSLEKLQNIDESIKLMNLNGNQSGAQFETLNLIGRAIQGDSTQIMRQDPKEEHDINFRLIKDATKVDVIIKDANGTVVRELEVRNLKEGQNVVTWNGLNSEGSSMGKGEFKVEIKAQDSSGKKIAAETKFAGVVTGVNYTGEGPILLMGKQKVRLKDIKSITAPEQLEKINTSQVTNEVQKNNGTVVSANSSNELMDNIAMSRDMINKVTKETNQ